MKWAGYRELGMRVGWDAGRVTRTAVHCHLICIVRGNSYEENWGAERLSSHSRARYPADPARPVRLASGTCRPRAGGSPGALGSVPGLLVLAFPTSCWPDRGRERPPYVLTTVTFQTTAPRQQEWGARSPSPRGASGREGQSLATQLSAPGLGLSRAKSRHVPRGPLVAMLPAPGSCRSGLKAAEGARTPFAPRERVRQGLRECLWEGGRPGWQVAKGAPGWGCS